MDNAIKSEFFLHVPHPTHILHDSKTEKYLIYCCNESGVDFSISRTFYNQPTCNLDARPLFAGHI